MIELLGREGRAALLPFYQNTKDTLLLSGLQGHLGRAFLSDQQKSCLVIVQGFIFLGGEPDEAFFCQAMACAPKYFLTFSGSKEWLAVAVAWGANVAMTRYDIENPPAFDQNKLRALAAPPSGFVIHRADEKLYRQCLSLSWCNDVVSAYGDYDDFRARGGAVFALDGDQIVAGCGAYAHADGQWEIEIDTHPDYRRRGLGTACGAAFLLLCLEKGIAPHWDAMTPISLSLAGKLGFGKAHPYLVVCREGE